MNPTYAAPRGYERTHSYELFRASAPRLFGFRVAGGLGGFGRGAGNCLKKRALF